MRQNFIRVMAPLIMLGFLIVQGSCINSSSTLKSSPESLAKEYCDCMQELKTFQNVDKRDQKLNECMNLLRRNLSKLRQLGIDNDWNSEQVRDANKLFDNVLDNCE